MSWECYELARDHDICLEPTAAVPWLYYRPGSRRDPYLGLFRLPTPTLLDQDRIFWVWAHRLWPGGEAHRRGAEAIMDSPGELVGQMLCAWG